MTQQSYSSLVDIASSWAEIGITVTPFGGSALDTADISAISHSGTVEVGEQRGANGGRVSARTRGSVSYEASITLYRRGLRKLVDALVEVAPEYALRGNQILIALIGFDLDVQHSPPGEPKISHHRLKGCRLLTYSDAMQEGNDADVIELGLNPIENVQIIDGGREVVLL